MPAQRKTARSTGSRTSASIPASIPAFTLVELLVAIGIITVLVGLLLPALARARRAADTVVCLSNLHSIGQAMNLYTTENNGWLPGSGWTSGAMFFDFHNNPPTPAIGLSINNSPGLNEPNDWIAPLNKYIGNSRDPIIAGNDDVARFNHYRSLPCLLCPAYRDTPVSASSLSSADLGPGQGISYCTSLAFLNKPWETFSSIANKSLNGSLVVPVDSTGNRGIITLPANYGPKITLIGNPSAKIFACDGSRSVIASPSAGINVENPPVYVISADPAVTNWDNTSFADYGAFGGWSHSAYRTAIRGNAAHVPLHDIRVWTYRHGTHSAFKPAGQYRMNTVFFDGHAECLDDISAANPALWIPRGSILYPKSGCSGSAVAGTTTVWTDVIPKYCPGLSSTSSPWTSP
jgi:prepilin-type processing-associated H-X9-DG protein